MIMNLHLTSGIIGHAASARAEPPAPARRMATREWRRVIGAWLQRKRQRRALARLDDRLLADVGLSRSEAAREIAKPFWC